MKKNTSYIMRLSIISIITVSIIIACNSTENDPKPSYIEDDYGFGYTNTLSGAFMIDSWIEEAQIGYNNHFYKISEQNKVSNTYGDIYTRPQDSSTLWLDIRVAWNDTIVDIYIDSIPLKGEPYKVTINTIAKGDITLRNGIDTITSNATPIEIDGNLERLNFRHKSRTSYVPFRWNCNLRIRTAFYTIPFVLNIESISDTDF